MNRNEAVKFNYLFCVCTDEKNTKFKFFTSFPAKFNIFWKTI